jgi:hypothetical protein
MNLCGSSLIPNFTVRWIDMRVPDHARRSVVFTGIMQKDIFKPKATGFLVHTMEDGLDFKFSYLVTAEHVVSGLLTKKHDIYYRLNLKDGTVKIDKLSTHWWYHPDQSINQTDVVLTEFQIDRNFVDHEYIPLPPERMNRILSPYGLGDEIFMVRLFKSHHGRERNIPIVRLGTIAAMPEEPIHTKYCGFMDAYLVEVRSIAGLSGSPVFLNVQALSSDHRDHPDDMYKLEVKEKSGLRYGRNRTEFETKRRGFKRDPEDLNWFRYRFLGLVHGHFDVENTSEDMVIDDLDGSGINAGIGVVVPASKILETLYQSDLVTERKAKNDELRKNALAVPDEPTGLRITPLVNKSHP